MTRQTLLTTIAAQGNISPVAAERVLQEYLRRDTRLVSHNAHDGYTVRHGAALDADVIHRALARAHTRKTPK